MKEMNSPRSTARLIPLSACTGPSAVAKLKERSTTSMTLTPTEGFSAVASGLNILSRDSRGGRVLLPCGERARLGGGRGSLDELCPARLAPGPALPPSHTG